MGFCDSESGSDNDSLSWSSTGTNNKRDRSLTSDETRAKKRKRMRERLAPFLPKGFLNPLPTPNLPIRNHNSESSSEHSPKTKSQAKAWVTHSNTKTSCNRGENGTTRPSKPNDNPRANPASGIKPSAKEIKSVIPHHRVDIGFWRDMLPEVLGWYEYQNWSNLLTLSKPIFPEVVRDFYKGKLTTNGESKIASKLGGGNVYVTESFIADLLNIPSDGLTYDDPKSFGNVRKDGLFDKAVRTIYQTGAVGYDTSKTLPQARFLLFQYKLAHFILVKCIRPNMGSLNTVTYEQAFVLYCLGHKVRVNLPMIILSQMSSCFASKTKALPYGALISLMCEKQGIPTYGSEIPPMTRESIGKDTLTKMQIKNVKGTWYWFERPVIEGGELGKEERDVENEKKDHDGEKQAPKKMSMGQILMSKVDAMLKMNYRSNRRVRSMSCWMNKVAVKLGVPPFVFKDEIDGKGDDEISDEECRTMIQFYGHEYARDGDDMENTEVPDNNDDDETLSLDF